MGLFGKKKKTFTLECPSCQSQWEIDKRTYNITAFNMRALTPAFTCPKCRCTGRKVK